MRLCLLALVMLAASSGIAARAAHAQAPDPHSVDAILVYEDDQREVRYAYRGHTPAVPTGATAIASWAWFSGDPATPTLDTAGVLGGGAEVGSAFRAQPRVAFSREGEALAIWSQNTKVDDIDCGSGLSLPFFNSRLVTARFQDGSPAPVAGPGIEAPESTAQVEHYFTAPSIAIDASGNGLAVWMHVIQRRQDPVLPCAVTEVSWTPHYGLWKNGAWEEVDDPHFAGDHIAPFPSGSPNAGDLPHEFATAVAFDARVLPGAGNPVTRHEAVAVWYDFAEIASKACGGPEPQPFAMFWPEYAVWDGLKFGTAAAVPGRRAVPGRWESVSHPAAAEEYRMDIATDQRGNAVAVFPAQTTEDPCAGISKEVFFARWGNGAWPKDATSIGTGADPTIAFRPATNGPPDQAADLWFRTPAPDYDLSRHTYRGFANDDTVSTGTEPAKGFSPSAAYLGGHHRKLAVYEGHPSGLVSWQEHDEISGARTGGTIGGVGRDPDVAARGGSTTAPHAHIGVMSYLAGDNNLDAGMQVRLDRLETVGSTDVTTWTVARDHPVGTSRAYFARKGLAKQVHDFGGDLDFSDDPSLATSLAWMREHYPADTHVVTLDDHGLGWPGLCTDDAGDELRIYEDELVDGLSQGLRGTPHWTPATGAQPARASHIILDACLMAMVEVAYELRGLTDYMLASGENSPVPGGAIGAPYDRILQRLVDDPFIAPANLARGIVDDYQAVNAGVFLRDYNETAVHAPSTAALVADLDALAQEVAAYVAPGTAGAAGRRGTIRGHRAASIRMRGDRSYRDVFDFAGRLAGDATLPATLRAAAGAVGGRAAGVVARSWSDVATRSDLAVRGANAWSGLNVWLEGTRANLVDAAGARTALLDNHIATDFGTDAPHWRDMLVAIAATPGLSIRMTSPDPRLFVRATAPSGEQVGTLAPAGEECGRFCGSEIAGASCSHSVEDESHIFIPTDEANGYRWHVDGSLLSEPATYELDITVLGTDDAVLLSRRISGEVSPGQVVDGLISLPRSGGGGQTGEGQTGGEAVGGGEQQRDTTAPRVSLRIATPQPLRKVLARGLPYRAGCSEACTLSIQVRVSRALAHRLRLHRVVGTAQEQLSTAGTRNGKVAFKPRARHRLRRVQRVDLAVQLRAVDTAANTRTTRRSLTLRR